jgi:hypothetical protein
LEYRYVRNLESTQRAFEDFSERTTMPHTTISMPGPGSGIRTAPKAIIPQPIARMANVLSILTLFYPFFLHKSGT